MQIRHAVSLLFVPSLCAFELKFFIRWLDTNNINKNNIYAVVAAASGATDKT